VLSCVLQQLSEIDGIEWIRVMYAFPTGFPTDVLEQIDRNDKVCRYLDMPVQHVADPVLASMRRGITGARLNDLIGEIRNNVPGIALRSTLIVGYPNEGEEEFRRLFDFVREVKFERLGVFTYSREDGTHAYPLGDPVPQEVKEERCKAIMEAQREISLAANARRVGTRMKMIVDHREGSAAIGRSEFDAPEVDNEITVQSASSMVAGNFYDVEIVDSAEYDLFAIPK